MQLSPIPDPVHILRSFEVIPIFRLGQPQPLTLLLVDSPALRFVTVFLAVSISIVRKE